MSKLEDFQAKIDAIKAGQDAQVASIALLDGVIAKSNDITASLQATDELVPEPAPEPEP